MTELRKTEVFARWLDDLRDLAVSELRIDHGPGYRVYFTRRGRAVIVLLAGGVKSTQAADIRTAQRLAEDLGEGRR